MTIINYNGIKTKNVWRKNWASEVLNAHKITCVIAPEKDVEIV